MIVHSLPKAAKYIFFSNRHSYTHYHNFYLLKSYEIENFYMQGIHVLEVNEIPFCWGYMTYGFNKDLNFITLPPVINLNKFFKEQKELLLLKQLELIT